jgi:hypothetical protein
MYHIINANRHGEYVIIADVCTLEEAAARRLVSGDLVVDSDFKIVRNPVWLFDWELADPECYARRIMKVGITLVKEVK